MLRKYLTRASRSNTGTRVRRPWILKVNGACFGVRHVVEERSVSFNTRVWVITDGRRFVMRSICTHIAKQSSLVWNHNLTEENSIERTSAYVVFEHISFLIQLLWVLTCITYITQPIMFTIVTFTYPPLAIIPLECYEKLNSRFALEHRYSPWSTTRHSLLTTPQREHRWKIFSNSSFVMPRTEPHFVSVKVPDSIHMKFVTWKEKSYTYPHVETWSPLRSLKSLCTPQSSRRIAGLVFYPFNWTYVVFEREAREFHSIHVVTRISLPTLNHVYYSLIA